MSAKGGGESTPCTQLKYFFKEKKKKNVLKRKNMCVFLRISFYLGFFSQNRHSVSIDRKIVKTPFFGFRRTLLTCHEIKSTS